MTVQKTDLSAEFVDYTMGLDYEAIPPEVVDRTKQLFLDFLGVALGGRVFAEPSGAILKGVRDLLNGQQGPCTAVGETTRFPSHFAALLNGAFAHGMDFDDTHRTAIMHPGAPVFATTMAAAEEHRSTGQEFLTSSIAAYDIACKVGRALGTGVHRQGLHPTATTGIFAATAGAARLMGLSREQTLNALGLNVSQAAGSQQFIEAGGWNKPLHVGLAAHNAIYALAMARNGFQGAVRPLDGRFGYFFSYSADAWDPAEISGLGTDFEVIRTAMKPYPCCRYNHGLIDAVTGLVREHQIAPGDIASMDLYIHPVGHQLVGEPPESKRVPDTVVEGQFSAYFAAAVAAVDGGYSWQSYGKLQDPTVRGLMQATTAHASPDMKGMASRVDIATKDGRTFTEDVALPKGEPENPMTWEEITGKFTSLAEESLGRSGARRVLEAVGELEQLTDFSRFTELLRP